jgi:hypothetical protein
VLVLDQTEYHLHTKCVTKQNVEARFHQQLSSKQVRYVREVFLDEVSKLIKADHVLRVAG